MKCQIVDKIYVDGTRSDPPNPGGRYHEYISYRQRRVPQKSGEGECSLQIQWNHMCTKLKINKFETELLHTTVSAKVPGVRILRIIIKN